VTTTPKTTVLLPIHRSKGNREWLQQARNSIGDSAKVLVLENDGEVCEALNAGLRATDTEFVIAMGADDLLGPDCIAFLEAPSWNADVVYPEMVLVDEELHHLGVHEADAFCPYRLQQLNFVSGGALYRREKALEVGGYRELETLEDWDLWVRMYRAGARFKPCPEAKYIYRQVPGSRNRGETPLEELRRGIVGTPDPVEDVVATFYCQATPATTYLRCQLPARYLPAIVNPNVRIDFDKEGNAEFLDHVGDAAIFQFAGDQVRALATQALREIKDVRTLLEVDDNYLINPGRDVLRNSGWSLEIGDAPSSRQGHRWIAERVDGIIVTTPALAEAYSKVNPNVYVCPNTVDPADWPEPKKPDDGIFRIAWMASKSHLPDIPLVTRAFEWASRQKDVEVYVCGFNPRFKFEHRYLDWIHDLDGYRDSFQQFDVGVAPIRKLPFALFRSDVKALEIGMGLGVPVLSDVAPYDSWVDGENCLKAGDAKGFLHAIKHLVTHRDEARQLAQAARDYALAERTTQKQIHLWKEAIGA